MAEGPGMGTTGMVDFLQRRTRRKPGSLIAGVPASDMRAMLVPFLSFWTSSSAIWVSLRSW